MLLREAAVTEPAHPASPVVWPERRGVGRPSTVAPFADRISQWLYAEPMLSGAEVLRRVRVIGYHGGKSALYELVRRLRPVVAQHN